MTGPSCTRVEPQLDLQLAINRFVAETNADPKPFVWTASLRRRQAWEASVGVNRLGGCRPRVASRANSGGIA